MEPCQQMVRTLFAKGEGVAAVVFGCIATSSKASVKLLQMVALLQRTLFTLITMGEGVPVEELLSTLQKMILSHISGKNAFT